MEVSIVGYIIPYWIIHLHNLRVRRTLRRRIYLRSSTARKYVRYRNKRHLEEEERKKKLLRTSVKAAPHIQSPFFP
ncbi:hypothetical protein BDZ91DRAFT_116378 [Kalaharituber pfeilii]|nr:hypothetical protein BDZ91DRAFT_116378 [Kalaharituber pfeilii]